MRCARPEHLPGDWPSAVAGCCLETHNEEADARIAAETRADTAEAWARELEAEFELR